MPGGAARSTKPPRRHVFSWLTIAGVSLAVALTFILVAAVWADTAAQERVVAGTAKADTIVGTSSHDRIYGRGGNDWLRGLGGNDVLDGGFGQDIVSGALGNDRIVVRDRMQDRVYCGLGKDTVVADARDRIHADCETVSLPGRPGTVPESRTDCATTNHTSWTLGGMQAWHHDHRHEPCMELQPATFDLRPASDQGHLDLHGAVGRRHRGDGELRLCRVTRNRRQPHSRHSR